MIVNQQTIESNVPSVQTGATALAANQKRTAWNIQNVGTNTLFVLLDSTGIGASTSVYHFVLKAGSSAADGTGGSVGQEVGTIYTGIISVAGTSPSYVVLEQGA